MAEDSNLVSICNVGDWPCQLSIAPAFNGVGVVRLRPGERWARPDSRSINEIERLQAVAVAAKRLVQTAHDYIDHDETTVEEPALTALESALEAAGYDMADGEFCGRLAAAPESRDG